MDTKRLILAVALSTIVLLVYYALFVPKQKPRPVQPQAQEQTAKPQGEPQQAPAGTPTQTGDTETPKSTSSGSIKLYSEEKKQAKPTVPELAQFEPIAENIEDLEEKEIVVETDLFKAVFTNKGAGLKSFSLKKYNDDTKQPLDLISSKVSQEFDRNPTETYQIYPFYFSTFAEDKEISELSLDLNKQRFAYEGNLTVNLMDSQESTKEIVFKYANVERNISVSKRFIFSNDTYVLEVKSEVIKDGQKLELPVIFGPDLENNVSRDRVMQSSLQITAYTGQDKKDVTFSGLKNGEKLGEFVEMFHGTVGSYFNWAAYETNYFAAIFKSQGQINYAMVKVKSQNEKEKPQLFSYITVSKPGLVYLGPKDEEVLESVGKAYPFKDVTKVVDYGWGFIGAIASIMLKCIVFIYGIIPNYGWALVIFTIFIKILLFPLTYTSSVSMAKMQTLQPKIKAIKKKYKNLRDPEQRRKMNEETMALYRQEKVNPAGGCLPLLLQMPILFAFFRLLPISINFRHEPWILWITDLSVKDPIYILPILMGATQIIVTKMSPTSADSGPQKKIAYIMPVVFVLLFMHYSAGLNLYWFISNLLQVAQQYIINKKIFKEKKTEDRLKRAQRRKKRG